MPFANLSLISSDSLLNTLFVSFAIFSWFLTLFFNAFVISPLLALSTLLTALLVPTPDNIEEIRG